MVMQINEYQHHYHLMLGTQRGGHHPNLQTWGRGLWGWISDSGGRKGATPLVWVSGWRFWGKRYDEASSRGTRKTANWIQLFLRKGVAIARVKKHSWVTLTETGRKEANRTKMWSSSSLLPPPAASSSSSALYGQSLTGSQLGEQKCGLQSLVPNIINQFRREGVLLIDNSLIAGIPGKQVVPRPGGCLTEPPQSPLGWENHNVWVYLLPIGNTNGENKRCWTLSS